VGQITSRKRENALFKTIKKQTWLDFYGKADENNLLMRGTEEVVSNAQGNTKRKAYETIDSSATRTAINLLKKKSARSPTRNSLIEGNGDEGDRRGHVRTFSFGGAYRNPGSIPAAGERKSSADVKELTTSFQGKPWVTGKGGDGGAGVHDTPQTLGVRVRDGIERGGENLRRNERVTETHVF